MAISASPTAWSPVYESEDADDTRVPEVAESLLTLIAGVTGLSLSLSLSLSVISVPFPDRYRNVPSEVHQLEFVALQRDLLLEFLRDLAATGEREPSLSPQLCSHLNACSYICSVLREWGEMKARSSYPQYIQV